MTEFENLQRKLEEKFLENKVRNMDASKREKFLEKYATFNYLAEKFTFLDLFEAKLLGKSFSIN